MINNLQTFYGIAIRKNTNMNVYTMKKAFASILYHCSEARSLELRHNLCPRTSDSWSKFQADKINKTNTYNEKPGLPVAIKNKIEPIFTVLSDNALLSKCLHGNTQNNNESLNGVIWKRCPKDVYLGRNVLEICVSSAVINFTNRALLMINVLNDINITPGLYTELYCRK